MNNTLKQLRLMRGWTQTELAKRAGVRQGLISDLENGGSATARKSTVAKLALALGISVDMCANALTQTLSEAAAQTRLSKQPHETEQENAFRTSEWRFMKDLDRDLAAALTRDLIILWTHESTTLEGNTLSIGETENILTHGVTVSGKTLLEHEEVHGHANALSLMAQLCKNGALCVSDIHELHHSVQTGVTRDIYAPIGKWKVEANGTRNALGSWHSYASPKDVPLLMDRWLDIFKQSVRDLKKIKTPSKLRKACLETHCTLHVAFTRIHPYADGNGRLARILANIPILAAGLPPLLISHASRATYIDLLSQHGQALGTITSSQELISKNTTYKKIVKFFNDSWDPTWELVKKYKQEQDKRGDST